MTLSRPLFTVLAFFQGMWMLKGVEQLESRAGMGRSSPGADSLSSLDQCSTLLQDLLEIPPEELDRQDVALLNLLCAPALPGREAFDIRKCLERLEKLAAFVKANTQRNHYRFLSDPRQRVQSSARWRMGLLITLVKADYGAAYSPGAAADIEAGIEAPFNDGSEIFIHGLLADNPTRRWGTCNSLPVLIAAVARRLKYPVRIALAHRHLYCRWDDGRERFNIEATNPAGMTSPSNTFYARWPKPLLPEERASGFYLRSLSAAEEFGLFLQNRTVCLYDTGRSDESLLWSARGLQFAPDAPHFARFAYAALDKGLKSRLAQIHPELKIPAISDPASKSFTFNLGEVLVPQEFSLYFTTVAHYQEHVAANGKHGELAKARQSYLDACRYNFHGHNEQRDLQRFIGKHGPGPRRGPLLPPPDFEQRRRFRLPNCPPQEQADALRRLADRFEQGGELLKARDALHDLYLFDPAGAEVFQRARSIEKNAEFQRQRKTAARARRAGVWFPGDRRF